jgi:hypothetical protein
VQFDAPDQEIDVKKKIIIGASLGALLAIPALGQMGRPDWNSAQTRAQVQAKVQQHFVAVDANKDGRVTKAEADAFQARHRAERDTKRGERRAERFTKLDTDRNGQLSPQEFAARPERDGHGGQGPHHGMRGGHRGGMHGMKGMRGDMFAAMDANKDGMVTLAEASARPLAMFDRADANKDGTVTPQERKAAFQAMRGQWKGQRD